MFELWGVWVRVHSFESFVHRWWVRGMERNDRLDLWVPLTDLDTGNCKFKKNLKLGEQKNEGKRITNHHLNWWIKLQDHIQRWQDCHKSWKHYRKLEANPDWEMRTLSPAAKTPSGLKNIVSETNSTLSVSEVFYSRKCPLHCYSSTNSIGPSALDIPSSVLATTSQYYFCLHWVFLKAAIAFLLPNHQKRTPFTLV